MTRLRQLFALAAIILMIIAAFVLRPPNTGTLRKAYILNARSLEQISAPFNQWSNAYAFQLIAGDGTPVKLGLGLMLAGGVFLGLSLNLGKRAGPRLLERGLGGEVFSDSGNAVSSTPLSTQWGEAGDASTESTAGDSSSPLSDSETELGGEVSPSDSHLPMFGEGLGLIEVASTPPRLLETASADEVSSTSTPSSTPPKPWKREPGGEGHTLGYIPLIIGLLCLAILTERNGDLFNIAPLQKLNVHAQSALLLFGLIFTAWGLIGKIPLAKWRGGQTVRSELLPLAAITLLALILRSWQLGSAIHGLIDEAHFINAITLLWQYPDDIRLLQPFSNIPAFPWVFPYAQWGGVEIFGNDLTGLRVISVLIGTATIPALYLLARSLFDKSTALIAALILATFPPHLHFSRAGINNIADPLMGTAALAFLAYGMRTRQRWPFVLAGLFLGLTQYFYDGGRLLYPVLTFLWLTLAHITARLSPSAQWGGGGDASSPLPMFGGVGPGGEGHPFRRRLTIFLITFLLIAAPIYYTRFGQDSGFSSRGQDVSAGSDFWRTVLVGDSGDLIYLRHLSYTFFIYIYMPEMSWFYGGDTPLILHAFVPLFLLGLFWSLWRWRQSGPLLLLLWLGLVAVGNTLLRESATSARYVVIFPALALLMAIGLRQAVALLLSDLWPQRAQYALIYLMVIAIAVTQTGYYFDRHVDAYNNGRLTLDADDVIFRAAALPPNTHVHIVYDIEIMRFNLDTLRRYLHRTDLEVLAMYPDRFTSFYLDGLPRDVNHAFFLPPDRHDLLALLVAYFELDPPQYSPYNVPREFQFVLYFAPADNNSDHPTDEIWMRRAPSE